MLNTADCLIEIHTEELPPKALLGLAQALQKEVSTRLEALNVPFQSVAFFASPRRLAVLIAHLGDKQPNQVVERKGPALQAAFDREGKPTPACAGFARSCGITPDALIIIKNAQGEWVGYKEEVAGQPVAALLPSLVEAAAIALPVPKRMRWGANDTQFVRPVHAVVILYGDQVVPGKVLGCEVGRTTHGHRFLAPDAINIPAASVYASLLQSEGWVMADFAARRAKIVEEANAILKQTVKQPAKVLFSSDAFLDEVTNLVEWPVALCGQFDAAFLQLPQEVLITAMQAHQRYFPVLDEQGKLLPFFITISNMLVSREMPNRIIAGNERVLRARLADAAFFYAEDQKNPLNSLVPGLDQIVFQAKLGSLGNKVRRLQQVIIKLAEQNKVNVKLAERAAHLSKADLVTNMVNEFPALQGVMGRYYALQNGEPAMVAGALQSYYLPRFANDQLPEDEIGQWLAIVDRVDSVVGSFGINQQPTGDKDPYGLRRATLGLLRIIIEKKLALNLTLLIEASLAAYAAQEVCFENRETASQVLNFMQERLKGFYLDQGVAPDVLAAVAALNLTVPLDIDARIKAVAAFKQSDAAEALASANKRVSNLLQKATTLSNQPLNAAIFENEAESALASALASNQQIVADFIAEANYAAALQALAILRQPVDDFFDKVMVMTEDAARRDNRLRLLMQLRALFLQVADIALLQAR